MEKDYKGTLIREVQPRDVPALKQLWVDVFGDPASLVDRFLALLPEMGCGCVAERDGKLLGSAYLIHGLTLVQPGDHSLRCGYLYAVGVAETARGEGLGSELSRTAVSFGRDADVELTATLPAELSLYHWYEDILSLTCQSVRTVYSVSTLPPAERITAAEYLSRREAVLHNRAHVSLSPAAMEFQEALCTCYGGGLFSGENLLFCAYREGDLWFISELLPTSSEAQIPKDFLAKTLPYVCSDVPFPDGFVWNLSFD